MANRKQRDSTGLQLVILGAVYFLVYVAPFLLLGFWLVAEIGARTKKVRLAAAARFPTMEEATELAKVAAFNSYADELIDQLMMEGDSHDIPRRQYDGLFDGRSAMGRKLNQQIEDAYRYRAKAEEIDKVIGGEVAQRQGLWASRLAQRYAARGGVIVWFITAQAIWHLRPDWQRPAAFAIASVTAIIVSLVLAIARKEALLDSLSEEQPAPDQELRASPIRPITAR